MTDKPSLIKVSTLIGYGSPNKADTHDVHGAPLGPEETAATRENLKWPYGEFEVPQEVSVNMRAVEGSDLVGRHSECRQTHCTGVLLMCALGAVVEHQQQQAQQGGKLGHTRGRVMLRQLLCRVCGILLPTRCLSSRNVVNPKLLRMADQPAATVFVSILYVPRCTMPWAPTSRRVLPLRSSGRLPWPPTSRSTPRRQRSLRA